jgi:hypothetical protein
MMFDSYAFEALLEVVCAESDQPLEAQTLPMRLVINVSPVALMRLCSQETALGEITAYRICDQATAFEAIA